MMGTSIDATKAEVARRTIAEKENSFVFVGDPKVNHKGVANAEGIQVINSAKTWKTMTSDEIVEQLRTSRAKITIIPGFKSANLKLMIAPEQFEGHQSVFIGRWFKTDSFIIMDTKPSTCEILIPEDIVRLKLSGLIQTGKCHLRNVVVAH